MFGILKFVWLIFKTFSELLNVNRNALKSVPDPTKYLSMILLSCFWCLAFGMYFGELLFIGYNMVGHIALITMGFVTWWTFKQYRSNGPVRVGADYLRAPDRSSRCDEYSDEERARLVRDTPTYVPPTRRSRGTG